MGKYEVSTLKKGLQILDLLKINRSLTLREICEMTSVKEDDSFSFSEYVGRHGLCQEK